MICVLRLGHRYERDKRVTTHVGLVSRAFGADKMFVARDKNIKKTVDDVTKRFGGDFKVEFYDNWKKTVKNWEGTKVHLTMYGEHINKVIKKIS
ncbi:MAG: tRNA (cytidine(56)-2'-O)-methyltransferase, partial [Candidatus Thermoplasmatota archaeon]|nr:tRNA (cytidine(56)-2'-O)-methyltransferase [Candidatus Thermoplasmatota archaeon]